MDPAVPPPTTAPASSHLYCPRCHYDLTGLNGNRCPECGQVFAQTAPDAEHRLAILAIRILALWLAATFLGHLVYGVIGFASLLWNAAWGGGPPGREFLTLLVISLPGLCLLAAAWWIWRQAPCLASRMLPPRAPVSDRRALRHGAILGIAISVIGVYLVADSFPHIVGGLASGFYSPYTEPRPWYNSLMDRSILVPIVRMLVGLVLIVRAQNLMHLVGWLRRAAGPAPAPDRRPGGPQGG